MKEYGDSGGIAFNLAHAGGELSASCALHFVPRERAPDTDWIEEWVGPRAGLDALGKRKIFNCCQELDIEPLFVHSIA
jgi:hypothetical protein